MKISTEVKNLSIKLSPIKQKKLEISEELSLVSTNKPNIFIYLFNKEIRKEYKKSVHSILNNIIIFPKLTIKCQKS